ncbi:MAG TPA: oligosaccharide flippase family protein [Vicinamibacterales bacterium]|nr:oligosaccharide flippase family protein [Vicinamibacterales bacterium]
MAAKGSLLVVTVVAARRLSPQAFGIFSLGSTLGWMAAVVSDFGIQLHVARAIARRPEAAVELLGRWLRVRWLTAAAALLIAVAGSALAPATRVYLAPMALLALVYVCSGLIEFLYYVYRGLSRSDIESTLTVSQRAATLACGIAALAWRPEVTRLALALLAPVVVTLAISVRIARSLTRASAAAAAAPPPRATTAPGVDSGPTLETLRREVWPIGAGIVLSALYFRVDVLLVQLWSGTEAVGLYNAVFRLVDALRLFPAAVMAVMLPSLCRAGDLRPLARASAVVTLPAVAVAAALWVAADALIPAVYQARYAAAVPAFRVLLLAFPLMSLNMALTHQLVGWDAQRAYAALCAAALAFNLALNARLIPAWSIDGAAWTTVATELCLTAGCAIALWTTQAPGHRTSAAERRPIPESVPAESS